MFVFCWSALQKQAAGRGLCSGLGGCRVRAGHQGRGRGRVSHPRGAALSAPGRSRCAAGGRVGHRVDQLAHNALLGGGHQGQVREQRRTVRVVAGGFAAEKLLQRNIQRGAHRLDRGQRGLVVPQRHHRQCGGRNAALAAQLRNAPAAGLYQLCQPRPHVKIIRRGCHIVPAAAPFLPFRRVFPQSIPYYNPPALWQLFSSHFYKFSEIFSRETKAPLRTTRHTHKTACQKTQER